MLMAMALGAVETVTTHSRFRQLTAERNEGVECSLMGIVTQTSALRDRVIVVAAMTDSFRSGIAVKLAENLPIPEEGDEVLLKGRAHFMAGGARFIEAEELAVERRGADLERSTRPSRNIDLAKGFLDLRRVRFEGRVVGISIAKTTSGESVSAVRCREERRLILVRVPGELEESEYVGRRIRATGVVFPVRGADGRRLDSAIELSSVADFELLEKDYRTPVLIAAAVVGGAAMIVFLALWLKTRRERIRLTAITEERRRMAQELHDTIEQYLASVRLVISGALETARLDAKTRHSLEYAGEVLAEAKREVREAVTTLRGDGSEGKTLRELVETMAETLNRGGKVRVRTLLKTLPADLTEARRMDLLLIAREAVTNAIKHGRARKIAIVHDSGHLFIANDGERFNPAAALGPETGHFGLSGMRERAVRSGFSLAISPRRRWMVVRVGLDGTGSTIIMPFCASSSSDC